MTVKDIEKFPEMHSEIEKSLHEITKKYGYYGLVGGWEIKGAYHSHRIYLHMELKSRD